MKLRIPRLLFTLSICSTAFADTPSKPKTLEQVTAIVNQYCGACHAVPSPNLMPKNSWPSVIEIMAELAEDRTGSPFISAEHIVDISAYYYGSAPEKLPVLPYFESTNSSISFTPREVSGHSSLPLIATINQVNLSDTDNAEFLVGDGSLNQLILLARVGNKWNEKILAKDVYMPSNTEVVDYDKDGDKDIIVSALGNLSVNTKAIEGQVVLLRQSTPGVFTKQVLSQGLGRVSDANAIDLDEDGDLDVAVAVFGSDNIGELAWLENLGNGKHVKHTLLNLSGGLNLTPIDLNNDGKQDLISFITQEHETLVGLINHGKGDFESRRLFVAGHPMVGVTALEFVDLDKDGDTDILFTNGDANDTQNDPKPYHGVQWLENKGNFQLQYHNIGRFYGAVKAQAGDMDGDGDLDIVASSWNNYWDDERRQSLVWYENDGKQQFTRHNIAHEPHSIATFQLSDVSGDNKLDIIAGVFRLDLLNDLVNKKKNPELSRSKPRLMLFESGKK